MLQTSPRVVVKLFGHLVFGHSFYGSLKPIIYSYFSRDDSSYLSSFALKGTYEKGTNEEIEGFIYQLLDVSDDGTLGR